LIASYVGDLPTGAAMVCAFGFMLAAGGLVYPFVHGDARQMLGRVMLAGRWALLVILAVSAVLLMAVPRAAAQHPPDGLRPLERCILRWRERGEDYLEVAARFHRSPGFVELVEELVDYKLSR